jgi:hypothetical protein
VARYLTSTKNLMGAAGGVIGLIITFLGLARATRRINGQRTAAEELTAQLELLEHDLTGTADQVYGTDAQRLRDQTRYLEERSSPRELDIPGRARQDNTDVS